MADSSKALKRIDVAQVRLGMHLHAMEGAWTDHPFWKTKFVLKDPADLTRLRQSRVTQVWINTDKGLDVTELASALPGVRPASSGQGTGQRAGGGLARLPSAAPAAAAAAPAPPPATPLTSMREELRLAAQVCDRSREAVTSMFNEIRLGHALNAEHCLPLVDDITSSVYRNPGALVSLARLKTADDYSYMHSVAVCALMVSLGRQLGLDEAACREAGLAGLLHDLGKAMMPLEVLNKPGKLTEEEFATMRSHPRLGWELLQEAQGASEQAMDVCLHHHERMDGTGYPDRLPGDQLSLLSRMGAVCDVYDAITSNRPYKAGWDPADSIARMASWKGHFDPDILRAFVTSLGIYPNGALVRMGSDRLAVVMAQNPQAITAPVVKVFFDARTEMPISPVVVDLSRVGIDRIASREPVGRWNFPHLDTLWAGEDVVPRRS